MADFGADRQLPDWSSLAGDQADARAALGHQGQLLHFVRDDERGLRGEERAVSQAAVLASAVPLDHHRKEAVPVIRVDQQLRLDDV